MSETIYIKTQTASNNIKPDSLTQNKKCDRGNIAIKQDVRDKQDQPIYIYFSMELNGLKLPLILQQSLKIGINHWGDDEYLNRIIFSEMIKNDFSKQTGYGISTNLGDSEYDIIYIDHDIQRIDIGDKHWSFSNYLRANLEHNDYTDN